MTRSARLLDLIQALRRRVRPVSAAELADEFGISLRTLYRDIATLQAQGAPIEGETGLGYVLKPGFVLPPLMFDDDEVDAIILGLRFVIQRGDQDLAAGAENALAKVEAVLPPATQGARAGNPLLAGPRQSGKPDRLAELRAAIRAERKIELRYKDKTDVTSDRVVWPIAVGFFETGETLAAWCESRADFRHFRLDRIVSLQPLEAKLPKRHRVLLAEWRLAEGLGDQL